MNEWELNEERHLLRLLIDAQNGISKLRTLTDLEKFLFIPTFKLQVRVSIGVKKLANNSGNPKLQSIYNLCTAHYLEMNYYVNFLGRLGSNGFQLI